MREVAALERFRAMPPTIEEIRTEPISIHLSVHERDSPMTLDIDIDRERKARVRNDRGAVPVEFELPEAAMDRFRELRARGRYCEIDGARPFWVDLQPPEVVRWLTVRVGLRYHETVLLGRAAGLERGRNEVPPVEPGAETLRRILDAWDEVLSWFDDHPAQSTRRWEDNFGRRSKPR